MLGLLGLSWWVWMIASFGVGAMIYYLLEPFVNHHGSDDDLLKDDEEEDRNL